MAGQGSRLPFPIAVIAKAAGCDVTWKTDSDLAAQKESGELAFGQWPMVEYDGMKIAQSGAIMRFFAKKGNLNGTTDAEYVLSEMLMSEAEDVWGQLTKALYDKVDGSNAAAFSKLFAADGWFGKHAVCIEKLLPLGSTFFSAGEKRLAGSYYMACVLDCALSVDAACLDATPRLKAFVKAMLELPEFADTKALHAYVKKD